MRDIELYRALLGLTALWTVAEVDVDMAGHRVMVRVDAGAGRTTVQSAEHRGHVWRQAPPLAPSRHDAVHDLDRGRRAAGRARHARRQAAPGAVGRAGLAVHRVVRTM